MKKKIHIDNHTIPLLKHIVHLRGSMPFVLSRLPLQHSFIRVETKSGKLKIITKCYNNYVGNLHKQIHIRQ